MTRPPSPYKGPRPFEARDAGKFFGRRTETREVAGLVVASKVVVLHAASGAGKTSLLEAGVIPRLVGKGFDVLPVARVGGWLAGVEPGANLAILNVVSAWTARPAAELEGLEIADALAGRREESGDGRVRPRLLVIDQFEELFTAEPVRSADRAEFMRQLQDALAADPGARLILAAREDYLAHLEDLLAPYWHVPRRNVRIELLREDAARAAIVGPAAGTGREFTGDAADRLLHDLMTVRFRRGEGLVAEQGEFVEPVQLQVVCESLWETLNGLAEPVSRITEEHVARHGRVDEALGDFYDAAVGRATAVPGVTEEQVRTWISEHLITPAGTRGLAYRSDDGGSAGLPAAAVAALVDAHVVRPEERHGSIWFELTHDRLIAPVQASHQAWLRRRGLVLSPKVKRTIGVLVLLVVALTAGLLYTVSLKVEADRQARLARSRAQASAAVATVGTRPDLAALVALEGLRLADTLEARSALLTVVRESRAASYLVHHAAEVRGVAVSADGTRAVTTGRDGDVVVWDVASGVPQATWSGGGALNGAALTPDGRFLAAGDDGGAALVWDLAEVDGDVLPDPVVLDEDGPVVAVALTDDGSQLVTGGAAGVGLWAVAPGARRNLASSDETVDGVAVSGDGRYAAAADRDGTVLVWDLQASPGAPATELRHDEGVRAVAFTPDGRVVTGADDFVVRVWDTAGGEETAELRGHTSRVWSIAVSPDGDAAVSSGDDGQVLLWDLAGTSAAVALRGHAGGVRAVAFGLDGLIASGGTDGAAVLWNARSPLERRALRGHETSVRDVAFRPGGVELASAGEDGRMIVWDLVTGQPRFADSMPGAVQALAYDADGNRLAAGGSFDGLAVWDAGSGELAAELPDVHTGTVWGIAFGPSGDALATADDRGRVVLWDLATGNSEALADGVAARTVAFSPDGRWLAWGRDDGIVVVWDVQAGAVEVELADLQNPVWEVSFRGDSARLAAGGNDTDVVMWETGGWNVVERLARHSDILRATRFAPGGALLGSAGQAGTIIVWDGGEPFAELRGHVGRVWTVAFQGPGGPVASGGVDGAVLVWPIDVDEAVASACRLAGRNLTQVEWERLAPEGDGYRRHCAAHPIGAGVADDAPAVDYP